MGRYAVLGHEQVTADNTSGGVPLPNPPNDNRVRRIVLRAKADYLFKSDGSDPNDGKGMYVLKDEIVVTDSDPALIRLYASPSADVRIIYYGT
jgi:hypothetical protein